MAEEDEQVGHLSDVLYILPSSFVATSRLSEESSIQVTTRVAAEKDLPSSELWGQLFCKELWRQMQFLLPSAWSCCREVLLQVYTCLSQDIAQTVSYETQLSCSIQQASTLEEGIFSLFNYQLMLKGYFPFSHTSYKKFFESRVFYTSQWPTLDIIGYCMCF